MRILTLLVLYTFTGLMITVVLDKPVDTQMLIADIVKFLAGGITGYTMHSLNDD